VISAVIFDLDGLLMDSEVYWERARHDYAAGWNCDWTPQDELTVKGMNSREWAAQIGQRCTLDVAPDTIIEGVTSRMRALYAEHLPLLPGARRAVETLAAVYPLAVASSSPPSLIDDVLRAAGLRPCFQVIVSSDEVGAGKPAPDVFLVTAERLQQPPDQIAVFEDSSSGILAAHRAGMHVIAVPNRHYRPSEDALALAARVLPSLEAFEPAMLQQLSPPSS